MPYALLADAVLGLHLAFIGFVLLGGLVVLHWPKLAWVHVPAAVWGVVIELAGWICPLTPLEVALRRRAGDPGYPGGFIEHYLTAVIYPAGLTRGVQIGIGVFALTVNSVLYWRLLVRHRA